MLLLDGDNSAVQSTVDPKQICHILSSGRRDMYALVKKKKLKQPCFIFFHTLQVSSTTYPIMSKRAGKSQKRSFWNFISRDSAKSNKVIPNRCKSNQNDPLPRSTHTISLHRRKKNPKALHVQNPPLK